MSHAPDFIDDRLRAIDADLHAGRLREAAATLDALAADAPNDWRVWMSGAAFARASANIALELESLQRAVRLAPPKAGVQAEVAKALSRAGRHDDAVAAAGRAVDLAPANLRLREVAVAVADAAGKLDIAERHLRAALAQRPADPTILRALARCLAKQHRYADAETLFRELLARHPDDLMALEWLSSVLTELGRRDDALAALERLRALAPHAPGLQFHVALARGETPPTAPLEMTRELFDEYATRFDQQLVGALRYRVPRRVAEIIRARTPGAPKDIVDLGCGTGLLGLYLGPVDGAFVGVDLSANMLEQAARHGIYTELVHADLVAYLRRTPPATFDCAAANDVFIYIGDMSPSVHGAFPALRSGGALIFTCEATAPGEPDLVFRPSKRYAHSLASAQALCLAAGFAVDTVEHVDLRLEKGAPLAGYIIVARKP